MEASFLSSPFLLFPHFFLPFFSFFPLSSSYRGSLGRAPCCGSHLRSFFFYACSVFVVLTVSYFFAVAMAGILPLLYFQFPFFYFIPSSAATMADMPRQDLFLLQQHCRNHSSLPVVTTGWAPKPSVFFLDSQPIWALLVPLLLIVTIINGISLPITRWAGIF